CRHGLMCQKHRTTRSSMYTSVSLQFYIYRHHPFSRPSQMQMASENTSSPVSQLGIQTRNSGGRFLLFFLSSDGRKRFFNARNTLSSRKNRVTLMSRSSKSDSISVLLSRKNRA